MRVPRRQRRRTAQPERGGLAGGRGDEGARGRKAGDPGTREAARPGQPEERGRPGGGAMPLAQLKEPWPLMELVPLDPEVSERGGGRAPAASEPGSPRGRGGSRRRCSLLGFLEGASALRSPALLRLHPPMLRVCVCARGTVPPSAQNPLSPERGIPRGPEIWLPSPHTPRTCTRSCRSLLYQHGGAGLRCQMSGILQETRVMGTPGLLDVSQRSTPRALRFSAADPSRVTPLDPWQLWNMG